MKKKSFSIPTVTILALLIVSVTVSTSFARTKYVTVQTQPAQSRDTNQNATDDWFFDSTLDFDQMRRQMDHIMHDIKRRSHYMGRAFDKESTFYSPDMDIASTETNYTVTVDIPGLAKSEIDIELKDDTLIIKGERKEAVEKEEGEYYLRERRFGSFGRSLKLPEDAIAEKISAEFDNGVLKINIPRKTEDAKEKEKRKIPIK